MAMICLSNIVVGVYMNNKSIVFGEELQSVAEEGIEFVKNFRDASNFQYKNQTKLKKDIQLRSYQQEGIQWLGFLTKFNLNGALCDDMGLGKTLQIFVLMENEYLKDEAEKN